MKKWVLIIVIVLILLLALIFFAIIAGFDFGSLFGNSTPAPAPAFVASLRSRLQGMLHGGTGR